MLSYACASGWRWGSDVIFTYGPGACYTYPNAAFDSAVFPRFLIVQILISLFASCILIFTGSRLASAFHQLWFYLLVLVVLRAFPNDALIFLLVTTTVLWLLRSSLRKEQHLIFLLFTTMFMALFALDKFTFALLSCVMSVIVGIHAVVTKKRRVNLLVPPLFMLFFLAGWWLLGQSLSDLGPFLSYSIELSSEFSSTMSLGFIGSELVCTLLVCVLTLLLLLLKIREEPTFEVFCYSICILMTVFLGWKSGFVRHDAHSLQFFALMVFLPFTVLTVFDRIRHLPSLVLCYLIAGISLYGLTLAGEGPLKLAGKWPTEVSGNFHNLVFYPDIVESRKARKAWMSQYYKLPVISGIVGNSTVDMIGLEQGILLLNDFNWKPRPLFQGYTAYTPSLRKLNTSFIQGADAPEYLLYKNQIVDGRFPMMNDKGVMEALLTRYKPIAYEKGYLLFQKKLENEEIGVAADDALFSKNLGENLDLTAFKGERIYLKVKIDQPLWLKLLTLLYRAPRYYIHVIAEGEHEHFFRILPKLAADGFLLSPLVIDETDLINWHTGGSLPVVSSVRVTAEYDLPWLARLSNLSVQYSVVPIKSRSGNGSHTSVSKLLDNYFPALLSGPSRVTRPFENILEDRVTVMMVHPPGAMSYPLESGKYLLTGQYGILAGAYSENNPFPTDGAGFSIILREGSGQETVLYDVLLNPSQVLSSRGPHEFSLDIEASMEGVVELRTTGGPKNELSSDWTYWRGVKLEKLVDPDVVR
ncbi:MAG: hypothetical protein PHC51_03820 [bacterium]|nr:hypothetical protein [bacterium]